MKKFSYLILALLLVALPVSVALAQDDGDEEEPVCDGLVIVGSWTRMALSLDGTGNSATFLHIFNPTDTDDVLLAASSEGATAIEIHETSMVEDVMQMRPVEGDIVVPAGGIVMLRPGGYHIMMIGLTDDITMDSELEVTLTFENAGDVTLSPAVGMEPPMHDDMNLAVAGDVSGCAPLNLYEAWSPPPMDGMGDMGQLVVGGYLLNLSDAEQTLTGVSSPIAGSAQLMDMQPDAMTMLEDGILVPPGEMAVLGDMGLQIVLSEITDMPELGDMFELTLSFAEGDDVTVMVMVKEPPDMPSMPMHGDMDGMDEMDGDMDDEMDGDMEATEEPAS